MKQILTLCVFLTLPLVCLAAETPVWVESVGEALLGEVETPKEVKERAKIDAQNKAVEKAVGVFIRSHTLVSNSQLAEDLIYAGVRGKIEKVNIVKEEWDEKDRNLYRVKLKVLVIPVYPEKGEGLSTKLSLSKTDLQEGDEVKIFYQVSADSYVYIFSVAADGSVTLLLPNSNMLDNFTRAARAYQFPPADSHIRLNAMFLPNYPKASAEEKIKIIATRQKEELLSIGFKEGLFQIYDAKSTGMISDLVQRLNQIELTDWAETSAVYHLKR